MNMIAYHALWDIVYLFGVKIAWYSSAPGYIWERVIAIGFIIISGFCAQLGSHRLRRSVFVIICGGVVCAVTLVALSDSPIYFGVLTFIGTAMLIAYLLQKSLSRINSYIGMSASIVLYIFTMNIDKGKLLIWQLPDALYKNMFTAALGFPFKGFVSADYFPLLPWIFIFFFGFFLYGAIKKKDFLTGKANPISFIGRHTLPIYMLHQPIIYAVLYIVFNVLE